MKHAIIIPSLNPGLELISLTDELIRMGADKIVIVNDGSDADHAHIFNQLKHSESIYIIEHNTNLGKGAALKSAFAYCAEHFTDIVGVITADCDGQHTPKDIFRITAALSQNPDSLILGVRAFDKSTTPRRSYIGNRTMSRIFNFLYHIDLPDTQTGLRGIPVAELGWISKTKGQRYDYEFNMLIQAKHRNIHMKQIPIEVLYFNDNQSSHFKTVVDASRIAKILLSNLFAGTGKKEPYYGKLSHFSRGFLRLFNKKLTVTGELPSEPVVIVGHHQNLKGALRTMLWLDIPFRVWMLGAFCDKESCFNQYANYTFTKRMGWSEDLGNATACILSHFIPKLAKSMRAIPVYRKSNKGQITFDQTVEALCNGENILIFPDIDYTSESDYMGDMYTGFIYIDKYYYDKTGKHIAFVPAQVNMDMNEIRMKQASYVQDGENYEHAKKRIVKELRQEMNTLSNIGFTTPKIIDTMGKTVTEATLNNYYRYH